MFLNNLKDNVKKRKTRTTSTEREKNASKELRTREIPT